MLKIPGVGGVGEMRLVVSWKVMKQGGRGSSFEPLHFLSFGYKTLYYYELWISSQCSTTANSEARHLNSRVTASPCVKWGEELPHRDVRRLRRENRFENALSIIKSCRILYRNVRVSNVVT